MAYLVAVKTIELGQQSAHILVQVLTHINNDCYDSAFTSALTDQCAAIISIHHVIQLQLTSYAKSDILHMYLSLLLKHNAFWFCQYDILCLWSRRQTTNKVGQLLGRGLVSEDDRLMKCTTSKLLTCRVTNGGPIWSAFYVVSQSKNKAT